MIGKTERSRRNAFRNSFLKACGLAQEQAEQWHKRTLETAFQNLVSLAKSATAPWIETGMRETSDGSTEAIRLVFDQLYLRRPLAPYRCSITGEIWPRSVAGISANANGNSNEYVYHGGEAHVGVGAESCAVWI